eukprot:6432732-Prymnesium_polylepis.1
MLDVWKLGGWNLPGHWDDGSLELRAVCTVLVTHGLVVDPSHLTSHRAERAAIRSTASCSGSPIPQHGSGTAASTLAASTPASPHAVGALPPKTPPIAPSPPRRQKNSPKGSSWA